MTTPRFLTQWERDDHERELRGEAPLGPSSAIERLEHELAVEREIVANLRWAVEQLPTPAGARAMRDVLALCEAWFSVHPDGREMRDVCRAALRLQ